jgi:hypothetical protein
MCCTRETSLHKSLNLAVQANVRKTSESCHFLKGASALEEKKYTAGQIDARWTPTIEEDYRSWLKQNKDHLSVPKEQIEEILKEHQ